MSSAELTMLPFEPAVAEAVPVAVEKPKPKPRQRKQAKKEVIEVPATIQEHHDEKENVPPNETKIEGEQTPEQVTPDLEPCAAEWLYYAPAEQYPMAQDLVIVAAGMGFVAGALFTSVLNAMWPSSKVVLDVAA